jgi:hypothetical protein
MISFRLQVWTKGLAKLNMFSALLSKIIQALKRVESENPTSANTGPPTADYSRLQQTTVVPVVPVVPVVSVEKVYVLCSATVVCCRLPVDYCSLQQSAYSLHVVYHSIAVVYWRYVQRPVVSHNSHNIQKSNYYFYSIYEMTLKAVSWLNYSKRTWKFCCLHVNIFSTIQSFIFIITLLPFSLATRLHSCWHHEGVWGSCQQIPLLSL